MTRIDTLQHGTNAIGVPVRTREGSWVRVDIYTNFADNHATNERRFASGPDDDSRLFTPWAGNGDTYSAECACCWLGFAHTFNRHYADIQPRTAGGSDAGN